VEPHTDAEDEGSERDASALDHDVAARIGEPLAAGCDAAAVADVDLAVAIEVTHGRASVELPSRAEVGPLRVDSGVSRRFVDRVAVDPCKIVVEAERVRGGGTLRRLRKVTGGVIEQRAIGAIDLLRPDEQVDLIVTGDVESHAARSEAVARIEDDSDPTA